MMNSGFDERDFTSKKFRVKGQDLVLVAAYERLDGLMSPRQ